MGTIRLSLAHSTRAAGWSTRTNSLRRSWVPTSRCSERRWGTRRLKAGRRSSRGSGDGRSENAPQSLSDPFVRCSRAAADKGRVLLGTVNLGPAEGGLGRNDGSFLDQSGARHLRPNKKGAGSQHPVIGWPQQVPPDPKEIQDDSVDRQESLRLSGGRR